MNPASIVPSIRNPEPKPSTYVHTGVTNSHRKEKKRHATTRAEKAENRLKAKNHLCDLLGELRETKRLADVERCYSKMAFLTCGEHSFSPMPNHVCEFRLCPYCSRRRSRKIINKYLPAMMDFSKTYEPVFLTLTQTHQEETFVESNERIMESFRKLIRRDFWEAHFAGGSWSLESTIDEKQLYHTHLHLIVFRKKFCDVDQLREEWKEVTGDSHVLRIERLTDLESGLREVFKYVTKVDEKLTAPKLKEILDAKGMKLFGTFGKFRNFATKFNRLHRSDNETEEETEKLKIAEGGNCPHCSQLLFELRMSDAGYVNFLKETEITYQKRE